MDYTASTHPNVRPPERRPRWRHPLRIAMVVALAVGACAALYFHASPRPADAANAVIALDMDPSTPGIQNTANYDEGTDSIQIDIVVLNANAIGAWEIYLSYDVTALEFLYWGQGPFLSSTGRATQCFQVITENTLRLGCTSTGIEPPGPSGDGVLASMYFRPRFSGGTCFSVLLVETAEVLGHALPTTSQTGCLIIIPHTATPTPTPTFTPTPTSTSSVTPTPTPTKTMTPTPTPTRTTVPSSATPDSTSTPDSGTRTPVRGTPTTPPRTPSPVSTVLGATPVPSAPASPTVISTVIGGGQRPPGQFPPTGGAGGFDPTSENGLITILSLIIGILLIVLVRRTIFDSSDRI